MGVVDQLEEVAVTGDDVDGHRRLRGEARDDVVGLVRRNSGDGDAEGIERGADDGDLRLEGVRHLFHIGGGLDEFGDAVRLVAGMRSTRHCGRQSSSQQATRWVGSYVITSFAIMSSSPRAALTGRPSAAFTVSGTP